MLEPLLCFSHQLSWISSKWYSLAPRETQIWLDSVTVAICKWSAIIHVAANTAKLYLLYEMRPSAPFPIVRYSWKYEDNTAVNNYFYLFMYPRVHPPPLVAWNDSMWIFKGHTGVMSHCVRLFFVTLVCSFPDVQTDTSALDAYRPSRCGCSWTILSKVCPLALSSREQRHWIHSVEPCCHSSSSPALLLLLFSPPLSQVITQWDAHCTAHTVVSSTGTLCFHCL